ncbi:hypothetical protein DMA11_14890 [Marinilabiliaceae bacterium JC017]|nr:hypothetical protein DMA11_14890 [Marinilabiliaceae bacterium JC017]
MKRILSTIVLSIFALRGYAQEIITVSLPLNDRFYIYQDSYKDGTGTTTSDANIFRFADGEINNRLYIDSDVTGKTVILENIINNDKFYEKGDGVTIIIKGNCIWNQYFRTYKGDIVFKGDCLGGFTTPKAIEVGQGKADCNLTLDLEYLNLINSSILPYTSFDHKITVLCKSGVINGGAIIANKDQTGDIVMGAASVNSTLQGNVIDTDDKAVYQVKLFHNNDKDFSIQSNGADYRDYSFSYFHKDEEGNDDPCYYIYLPDGDYSVTTGTETYIFTVNGKAVDLTVKPAIAGNGIINLSEGDFSIINEGYQVGDQPYTYDGTDGYTFTGTTTGTVTIPADFPSDAITLHNLNIDRSKAVTDDKAIIIEKSDDFEVILDGNSNFKGNSSKNGNIVYTGSGTLTLRGTSANNSDTLYLSQMSSINAPKLIINGGTIYNNDGGAVSTGESLVVEGGAVYCYYIGSTTIVNGGVFKKFPDNKSSNYTTAGAIGTITFNGGTSYIELWNAENPGLDENVKINGGSVCIANPCNATSGNFDGTYHFAANGSPTRTGGAERIFQSTYKLPVSAGTKVDAITIDDTPYPCNDVFTDNESSVYLWLPETEDIGDNPVTNVNISIGGIEFKFGGFVDTQFKYTPYIDAMTPGQGNKQELIPLVSTVTTNGSFSLSGAYAVEYNSNCYACSGSEVSIATTPDANYELESITINGTNFADGETTFTVVRPDQPVTQMEVSVGFVGISTAINTNDISKVKVFGVENAINIQGAEHARVQIINLNGIKVYDEQNVISDYITLKSGMYIVIVDNSTYKAMVR